MDEAKKANWVTRREIVENQSVIGFVHISDKGALKVTSVDGNGQERFLFCIMPASLPYAAAFDFEALLNSPEYKAIREEAVKTKERSKIELQQQREIQKQALKAQAALEHLKRLGVDTSKLVG